MIIRQETPFDDEKINDLTIRAFTPMAFSDGTEAAIIRSLRRAGDLTLSLVAVDDNGIVGHVAFSPVTIDDVHAGWFGLGPISVEPDRQRGGIGRLLIITGLASLRRHGATGVALIGNPQIYKQFGFESDGNLSYKGVDGNLVQRIVFSGDPPKGELRFAAAFDSQ